MEYAIQLFKEYGFVGLIVGALLLMAWRREVWIMAFVKEQRECHELERKQWQEKQDAQTKVLNEISSTIEKHDNRAEERGRYVRREHEEFAHQLKGLTEAVGRINGFTHG